MYKIEDIKDFTIAVYIPQRIAHELAKQLLEQRERNAKLLEEAELASDEPTVSSLS